MPKIKLSRKLRKRDNLRDSWGGNRPSGVWDYGDYVIIVAEQYDLRPPAPEPKRLGWARAYKYAALAARHLYTQHPGTHPHMSYREGYLVADGAIVITWGDTLRGVAWALDRRDGYRATGEERDQAFAAQINATLITCPECGQAEAKREGAMVAEFGFAADGKTPYTVARYPQITYRCTDPTCGHECIAPPFADLPGDPDPDPDRNSDPHPHRIST